MLTYWWVLNDYGIPMGTTLFLNQANGYNPLPTDVYNPDNPNYGNSNWGDSSQANQLIWGLTYQSGVDVRVFFTGLTKKDWVQCRWDPQDSSIPEFYRISPYTNKQICYTPEALLYAQTAYFVAAMLT